MHNHPHCKHKLEFCDHCDVVFCTVCKKEWRQYYYNTSGFGTSGTWTYPPTAVWTSPETTGGSGAMLCNHSTK